MIGSNILKGSNNFQIVKHGGADDVIETYVFDKLNHAEFEQSTMYGLFIDHSYHLKGVVFAVRL